MTATLPDYDGPLNGPASPFPINLGVIGTFTYGLPVGATVTGATISGTYGTVAFSASTAGFDLLIEGSQIVACVPFAANCWQNGTAFRPFSFAIPAASFGGLADGSAQLSVIQTNYSFVRYGSPTLTIDYTGVPEPAAGGLIGCALAGLIALKKAWRVRASV